MLKRCFPAPSYLIRIGRTQYQRVRHGSQRRKVLDRLMGRAIFTQADTIMREDKNRRNIRQCRKTNSGTTIVRKYKKCTGIWDNTTVQIHPSKSSTHSVLTYSKVDIATG